MALSEDTKRRIREHAAKLAAEAPPLTAETRDRLHALLGSTRKASVPERRPLRLAA
ncbi:hypothetical protein ACFWGM_17475 [Streptomyces roseolus]|uniref:hypothetical protein n=1 Tax=Streptomyces roseolus TaxID=67358 RepID=UPI003643A44E